MIQDPAHALHMCLMAREIVAVKTMNAGEAQQLLPARAEIAGWNPGERDKA
jgi:hypothetical protein